jgi:rhamnosyltransferase
VSGVTVAIPVRNGGAVFERVLDALAAQTVAHELLVCDSGSSDESVRCAREHGARVIEIGRREFSHGGTRNLLMASAAGDHVALLTHDAEPAEPTWLERLLDGFALGDDVAIVFGPYRPRADASPPVRVELERFFASLSPDGQPSVIRVPATERSAPARTLIGRTGFFTDANACVLRSAWEVVPFRKVAYAEDRVLALDMLRAGYAKAYMPAAPVLHSHDYTPAQELRRSFDEWRGLLEVYGWREPAGPRQVALRLRGELGADSRALAQERLGMLGKARRLAAAALHHGLRATGAILGSRADRLPAAVRRVLSLERRAGFAPLQFDPPVPGPPTEVPKP